MVQMTEILPARTDCGHLLSEVRLYPLPGYAVGVLHDELGVVLLNSS